MKKDMIKIEEHKLVFQDILINLLAELNPQRNNFCDSPYSPV